MVEILILISQLEGFVMEESLLIILVNTSFLILRRKKRNLGSCLIILLLNVIFSEKKASTQMFVLHFLMVLTLFIVYFCFGDFVCIDIQENEDIGVSFVFLIY